MSTFNISQLGTWDSQCNLFCQFYLVSVLSCLAGLNYLVLSFTHLKWETDFNFKQARNAFERSPIPPQILTLEAGCVISLDPLFKPGAPDFHNFP